MGMGISAIKLYLELYQRGIFKDSQSVMEMGSQELHLKQSDFEQLLFIAGINNYQKVAFSTWNWPEQPRCSSRPFFNLLGLNEYSSIDLNQEHGSIPLDLNLPLEDSSLFCKYDIVTDHGCNEHAFNIAEAYRTMHRLCKNGGLIVIDQSVWHGNGYYLFDLSFFEGIAAANNYKILFSGYIVTLNTSTKAGSNMQFHIPLSRDLLDALDRSKVRSVNITYIFKKQSENDFKYPYQDSYLSQRENNYGYIIQFLPEPPSRTYVPVTSQTSSLDTIRSKSLIKCLAKRIIKRVVKY